ncbi:HNH endonuclease signature motif containing protein [Microbacterium hydrocarbonoxydans]|uniref:HNH endonuclease signature motif containing protein n=1 Tax=Microbacterium hydrocarbonoxydans TaxID=273678 RepID=UPI00203CB470|nr:HNH endonuclease signature motif containing protein [Microbacterium hydrocarbonoxydans]MCM3779739.1 HNH endonuclease [Microbacterium hydrocarbonoxydans]
MSSRPRTLLDQVVADLDRVLADDSLAGLTEAERVAVLATAGDAFRRVEAVIVETVASGDVDFPRSAGCRNENELLRRALLVDTGGASRLVKVVDLVRRQSSLTSGERLPARWPALREALLDGTVGTAGVLAATAPIEKVVDRIGLDGRLGADECLADAARGAHDSPESPAAEGVAGDADRASGRGPAPMPEDLRLLAEALVELLDPDGEEPADEAARRRGITIGRLRNGLRPITGALTPEVAAQLELIFDAQNNPKGDGPPRLGVRFAPTDADGSGADGSGADGSGADGSGAGRSGVDGSGVEGLGVDDSRVREPDPFNSDPRAVIDDRTATQKRHDALAAALGIAARHRDMPSLGGAAPTLVVTVDAKDLAGGGGRASVPGAWNQTHAYVAAHVGCSGTIQRVTMDEGRIVGIDSTDRVFTVHQRRAIVARDKECLIPGCHVPASWCEIHHVTEHARGGPTHTDNGVPLCWWHHRSLGSSGWEIRMGDGVPQVRGPAWWDPTRQWRAPRLSLPRVRHDRGKTALPRAG